MSKSIYSCLSVVNRKSSCLLVPAVRKACWSDVITRCLTNWQALRLRHTDAFRFRVRNSDIRPSGRPRTHCKVYISHLVRNCLRITHRELDDVVREKDVCCHRDLDLDNLHDWKAYKNTVFTHFTICSAVSLWKILNRIHLKTIQMCFYHIQSSILLYYTYYNCGCYLKRRMTRSILKS